MLKYLYFTSLLIFFVKVNFSQNIFGSSAKKLEKTANAQFLNNNYNNAAANYIQLALFYNKKRNPELEILNLYKTAESYIEINNIDTALNIVIQIEELTKTHEGNSDSILLNRTLLQRAIVYQLTDSLSQKGEKLLYQLEQKKNTIRDSSTLCQLHYELGRQKLNESKFQESEKLFLLSKSYLPTSFTTFYELKINLKLGKVYYRLSKFDLSEEYLLKALTLISNTTDPHIIANIYNELAKVFVTTNNFTQGEFYLEKALKILDKNTFLDYEELIQNKTLNALMYKKQGKYKNALKTNFEVLSLKKEYHGENSLESEVTLNNIGLIYDKTGNIQKAIQYLEQSLNILDLYYQEDHFQKAKTLNNLGLCFKSNGNYIKSIEYHKRALKMILNEFGEEHIEVAINNHNLGINYNHIEYFDSALYHINKSKVISRSLFGSTSPKLSYSNDAFAQIYSKMQRIDSALFYLNKNLIIYTSLYGPNHPIIASTYNKLGNICLNANENDLAISFFDSALHSNVIENELLKNLLIRDSNIILSNISILNPKLFLESLTLLARSHFANYKVNTQNKSLLQSSHLYDLAFQVIELLKNDFNSEKSLLDLKNLIKEEISYVIEIDYELYQKKLLGNLENIYEHIEIIKSPALYSTLFSNNNEANDSDSLQILIKNENELLKSYKKKRFKQLLKNTNIYSEKNEIFETFIQIDSIKKVYKERYPEYYKARFNTPYEPLLAIKSAILSNEALISYCITEENIFALFLSKQQNEFIKLTTNGSIIDSILLYNSTLANFDFETTNRLNNYLYNQLIKPISKLLKDKKSLIIIPDDLLATLPFETLSSTPILNYNYSEADYLNNNYSISYHYNASSWLKGKNTTFNDHKMEFAGFAPVFDNEVITVSEIDMLSINETGDQQNIYRSGNNFYFKELPFSDDEIINIQKLLIDAGFEAKTFIQDSASESIFKTNISDYKLLHIATHGIVNYNSPNLSALILSQDKNTSENNDGILYTGEINSLELNAELVVLSSCESGIGTLIKGDGLQSMSRAFYSAGVPNILYSLWKVPDNSTSKLMIEFYKNIISGNSYRESLQKAKLSLSSNPEYAFPQFWGGFVLLGN